MVISKIRTTNYYSISIFPTLKFLRPRAPSNLGGERGVGPQKPCETAPHHFLYFSKIGIRNSLYILLIYSLVQNSAYLCFYSILSDISGLLQGSLANYVFLHSISQLLTLNPSNHDIITLASFLEFDICYLSVL